MSPLVPLAPLSSNRPDRQAGTGRLAAKWMK
jgi:hypothetical protein